MPSGQSNVVHSLAHTKWNCKYHSERYMKFAYRNREFWCKGYYVDTVGKTTTAIKNYIANQLKRDREANQLSIFDPRDPFTGSK